MSLFDHDAEPRRPDSVLEEPRLLTRRNESEPIPNYDRESKRQEHVHGDLRGRSRFRRWGLRALYGIVSVAVVLLAAVVGTALWLRHSMRAALPQLDGDIHVAGLSAPVSVTRDAQGVPSIQAQTVDDVLFAQGYVTAQDRLWQMDSLRRHAAGELAEILGSTLVEHDRMQRTLRMRETAEAAVGVLPADQLHQLEAYARGVNAFIEQNEDHLPVEFHLLRYKPAPWTPRDSMLVSLAMFQDLATDFPTKMRREALSAHLPAQLLADLYPVSSWRDRPPTQPAPDLTTPKPAIEEIPLDDTQTKLEKASPASPQELLHVASILSREACDGCRAGSNNWAVAASRSASGFPLVSNDMHLSLSVPDIWYEAGLHAARGPAGSAMDVVGFTLPGAPFVIVGRNAHVAWSFTNLGADVQDVHIEHTRGSGSSLEYEKADGSWASVGHDHEHIRVRGGRDVDFDVLTTTALIGTTEIKTPVISSLYPSEKRILSLAWTPYDPKNLSAPFLAADSAADGRALLSAFSTFGGPSLNLVYADDAKHIGYHALGRIPVRGPAQRRSRNLASPEEQKGPAPPDNDEEPDGTTQNPAAAPTSFGARAGGLRFVEAGYSQRRGRRSARAQRQTGEPAAPAPVEAPIPAPPAPNDFTIGSAISSVPVDALDLSQQWSGYVPFDQLPAIVDPPNGILATANARIAPDDYEYFLANDWTAPYRAERIYKLLEGRRELTPADMLATQTDIHSELDLVIAQRLAYALDHASDAALKSDAKRLHQAADILRAWDGTVSADSSAAAVVLAFRTVIWPALLAPQIAEHDHLQRSDAAEKELTQLYRWGGDSVALEELLQHTPVRWLPPGVSNWNDLLVQTLSRGFAESHAPSDLSKWRYGAMHPVEITHPVFSMSPVFDRVLGVRTGSGRQQTGGDGTTVKAIGLHFGPSERFTADLRDAQATDGDITTGQSGNPASTWYLDQFRPWLEGTTFPLPLAANGATHTLRLLP